MKKFMILALCAWTFFACGNGKENETATANKPKSLYEEWITIAKNDSLQLVAGGVVYDVKNFDSAGNMSFNFELHNDSTVFAVQGYVTGSSGSEKDELEFNGLQVGGSSIIQERSYYYLLTRIGGLQIDDKFYHPILFRRKP